MFTNPTAPNLVDFATYVADQGVPSTSLPSGTLVTVNIDTQGNVTCASTTGTVAAGMVIVGAGIPTGAYLTTWVGTAGTLSTPPATSIVGLASANAFSAYLLWAINQATAVALVPPADMPPILYVLSVYQYGMHTLLKIAQDAGGTWFTDARKTYGLLSFAAGPVISSGDNGTNVTLAEPEFLKGLTMSALDLIKTPWGQQYLDYAQQYGPNVVGVS